MANDHKLRLLATLEKYFGAIRRLPNTNSLFDIAEEQARIYVRYSKLHDRGRTFFGLRDIDLRALEGRKSFLCFLLDDGSEPLFINYADFELVFRDAEAAADGQHKVQLISGKGSLELYIAKQGRFNVDGYVGFRTLQRHISPGAKSMRPSLSHSQVQTLLAGIGRLKGYSVWIPDTDIGRLDWSLTEQFQTARSIPAGYEKVVAIAQEVDVIWIRAGSNQIEALFEVEHSTPVYSGLLRFNDIFLTAPSLNRFSVVSNENRRDLFARQIRRPTFQKSGLSEVTMFMEYSNVYDWHKRIEESQRNR